MKKQAEFCRLFCLGPIQYIRQCSFAVTLYDCYILIYMVEEDIYHMFFFCNFVMLAFDLCHTER